MSKLDLVGRFESYAQGEWGEVGAICGSGGAFESTIYRDNLPKQAQAQLQSLVKQLAAKGSIVNDLKFHRLQHKDKPQVWELKIHHGSGHRFYCVQHGRYWLISHGGAKPKNNRLYDVEVTRCKNTFEQWGSGAK